MKRLSTVLGLLMVAALQAGPVNTARLSADARWLLHLDVDAFRQSKLGAYVLREFVEKKLAAVPKPSPDVDLVVLARKLSAVTLYGMDYEKNSGQAAILVTTDADTVKVLEGIAAAAMERKPDGGLKRIQEQPHSIYQLKSDAFAAHPTPGLIVLAKTREQLDRATDVVLGKTPSLKGGATFKDLPTPGGAFVSAMAVSFSQLASIPPQARVLQMAEAGSLSLGESAEKLALTLTLRAKTAEASTQMKQVVEGLVALFSLSGNTNQELTALAKGLKVTNVENVVTVQLDYPVPDAMKKIADRAGLPAPQP